MDWKEFCTLLAGIMPETPLGSIVGIRAEEDKDKLKYFSKDQHRIRNEWRYNHNPVDRMSEEDKKELVKRAQDIFAKAFT